MWQVTSGVRQATTNQLLPIRNEDEDISEPFGNGSEEIAAVCLCSPKLGTAATTGYIDTLGVRRAWRKRGPGLALLRHAFRVLRELGKEHVALHVDVQSLTVATRLYEKAGMHVDQLAHEYQLEQQPAALLSTVKSGWNT